MLGTKKPCSLHLWNRTAHFSRGRIYNINDGCVPFRWACSRALVLCVPSHWHDLLGHLVEQSCRCHHWSHVLFLSRCLPQRGSFVIWMLKLGHYWYWYYVHKTLNALFWTLPSDWGTILSCTSHCSADRAYLMTFPIRTLPLHKSDAIFKCSN